MVLVSNDRELAERIAREDERVAMIVLVGQGECPPGYETHVDERICAWGKVCVKKLTDRVVKEYLAPFYRF